MTPGEGALGGDAAVPTDGDGRLPIEDCHILVVDDTDFNRTLIGALLGEAGFHNVDFAKDGFEALEKIAARMPDLLVLDIMMPGMDGFEVCRRLRADHAYADLPILVQTALSSGDDRNRAFAAGTTDLISKPLERTELLARVRIHLENRVLIRDLQLYRARVEGELALARSMYDHLLPGEAACKALAAATGVTLRSHSALSSEMGGGIWGVLTLADGRFGVYLLDLDGHGVSAALNAFRMHTLIRELAGELADNAGDPAAFLSELNERAERFLEPGERAALLYGLVDAAGGGFTYASADAAPPQPVAGDAGEAPPAGPPIGTAGARYAAHRLPFGPGAALLLHSKGVLEGVAGALAGVPGCASAEGFALLARAVAEAAPDTDHTLVWLDRSGA